MRYWSASRIKPLSCALVHALSMLSAAGLSGPASAAAISWTPNADGFWDVATNWSSNPLLPGATDDVTINVAGLVTVTYRSITATVNSLTSQENFVMSGGNLTVANAFSNAGDTTISGGNLTLNGTSTLASLTHSSALLAGSGLVTVSGASSWTGGTHTGSGTTQFDAALSITGSGTKGITATRTVTLNGTTTWSGNTSGGGNTISLASTATINNAGSFSDSNAFNTSVTGGTFNNSGIFDKQSNTTTTIGSVFNNTGTVNVNAGTMLMNAAGTSSGLFNLAAGALLEFRNGTHTLNNVTTSGAGTFQISTDNVGADALVTVNGGTLNSAFLLSGSTMNGTDQIFQGPSTWTGGTITGTAAQSTTFSGALTISGANTKVLSGGRSINAGNTTWTGNTANGNNAIAISQAGAFNNTGTFTDANTFDSAINAGGGGGIFNNTGTFNKQSNTTTSIGTVFNSNGTVNVNAGTMLMNGGGTDSGVFNIANGAKLEFRNGSHALNNVTTSGAGTFEISTENVGADATVAVNGGTHTTAFVLSGSILTGTSHTFQGLATWSGGTITGTSAASTTFANDLTISGPNSKTLSGGRSVNAGNTLWTGNTGNGNNAIGISGASAFNSSGTFTDANTFDSAINVGNGGGAFNNNGIFNKQSNTTTAVGTQFNSTGTVNVNAGTMLMNGGGTDSGVFNIANGAKLEFRNGNHTLNNVTTSGAGTFEISTENVGADAFVAVNGGTHTTRFVLSGSTMAGSDATFQGLATWTGGTISGAAATTFSNNVAISGANSKTILGGRVVNLNATTTWSGNTADNNNAISFWNGATINNNGTFNDANAFASFIEHVVGGPHNFNNIGTYNKQSNTVTTVDLGVVFNNSGTLNLNAGTMRFVSGTQGPTGTVNVASGATFQHDAASSVGNMNTAGNLVLAGGTLTVFSDYNNANFGVGDAFNRRANVSSTGAGNRLIAAGDANQGITGAIVSNGTSTAPTLVIGNVRVGANTFTYDIANVGTTGPALRGAIQTGVNGANISDARLSGTGVTAGNWGPIATGASLSRDVTITVNTAGIFTPLAGQAVNILNNFENTRSQLLTITSAAGAAAYNAASGSATPTPVVLANQRVGGTGTQVLTVTNTAAAGSFSEDLNASFVSSTGNATGSGAISGRLAGTSNTGSGSMAVGVDTSAAGARSGSVTISYQTAGAVNGVSNGLGVTGVGSQTINVSGNVYQVAAGQIVTAPLNFGTVQVGQVVSQNLVIGNTATGAAGFVEDLNASFGASGDARISGAGSLSGILAGTNSTVANGTMTVSVNTAAAGVVNSSIGVNFVSAGAVNGVSNGLGTLGVGSENYGVSGTIQATVINTASPVINNSPINLGNVRVGDTSPTAFVSVTNQAGTPPQAALNATISGNAPVTASGSFNLLNPGATNSGSLQVGMNTASAGAINGTATLSFVSDASNVGGCAPNCQLNLPSQNVIVTGGVYQVAQPNLPTTVNLGNVHVGGTLSQAIAIGNTNIAPAGYQEGLNVAVGGTSGGATGSGSITNLAAGGSSNAITVGLAGIGAGNQSGQVNLNLASNGSGTSGLAPLSLGTQAVTVNAVGYTLAQASVTPAPVTLANQRIGGTLTQALTVANTAPSSGFTETLSASFGGSSGNATHNGGSASGIAGGASNSAALAVGVNTSGSGARSGSVTVNLSSSEVNGSGLGTTALAPQTINVSGNVYQVAAGQIVTAPLNFGTVQVGQVVSQNLVIGNTATGAAGFVEDLNASFGASGDARISGAGSLSGILAGTNSTVANGTMTVSVNTAAAGVVNSSIGVNFVSAGAVGGVSNGLGTLGVGSANYGVAGSIQANVVDQAKPVINGVANPGAVSVNLGSVRIGTAANQALTVLNQATGNQQAALNGSIATNGTPVLASGSFNLLAPGATSGSLSVGIDTSAAGVRAGSATVSLVSDASNIGGCGGNCQVTLPNQIVNVSADVYRLANPVLNTGTVTIAARVGDAVAANQGVSITNASPDIYTEGLRVNVTGTSGNAQGNGGSISNLAAQGTDATSIRVGLGSTAVAGLTSGTVSLGYVSTGAGTTGASDLSIGAGLVTVSGKVYAPAQAQIGNTSIDFGIVHVGDSVAPLALNVANVAPVTALNDTLQASFGAVSGPFSGTGAIAGLAAGASDGTSLAVGLNTAAAGIFNGTGSVNLASHNADMTDLTLSPASLIFAAQINNYANPEFVKTAGTGSLSGSGTTFALDLGDFFVGSGVATASLGVLNNVAGPADLVDGTFNLSGVDDFVLSGFGPFTNLSAAQLFSGLLASFSATAVGSFDDTVLLLARGYNASGYEQQFNLTLLLHADVLPSGAVPEPRSIALLLAALMVLGCATRRRSSSRLR